MAFLCFYCIYAKSKKRHPALR